MQALLKSYQLGIDCGPSFSVSSKNVNILPSIITRQQLLDGIYINFDQDIDAVRISSLGKCFGSFYDVFLNKECNFDLPDNLLATEMEDLFQTENEQFIEVFVKN